MKRKEIDATPAEENGTFEHVLSAPAKEESGTLGQIRSLLNPSEAAAAYGPLFSMSEEETNYLCETLSHSGGDPIVLMKLNDRWLEKFGESAAISIFERIDGFEMPDRQRRSNGPYKWLFRFADSDEISRCRADVRAHYKDAFGNASTIVAIMAAAGFPNVINEHPMAKTLIFREVEALKYDVQDFPFFYNWPE